MSCSTVVTRFGESLLDLFKKDEDFRKACLQFVAGFKTQSTNLTNSPRIDELQRLIAKHWDGSILLLGDDPKPWADLERLIGQLLPEERAAIVSSSAWKGMIADQMLDEEIPRFWSLVSRKGSVQ